MPLDRPLALSSQPLASIIVCESAPYWAPELQRRFQQTGVAVRGCRKWAELMELTANPQAIGVIDLQAVATECLTGLARLQRAVRLPPLVAISSPQLAELEGVLREAGVAAFFPDLPTSDELTACCRRFLT